MLKLFIIVALSLFLVISFSFAQSNSHSYSTWDVFEVDTCASVWLIKKFVDKEAQFKFYPKGEIITEGVPFDTPDAELRRRDNMSTFESIVNKFKLADPAIKEIALIIHDIEINYWGKKVRKESEELNKTMQEIINSSKNNQDCLQRCFAIFDQLYEELKK